jgi:hypothetical protein
MDSTSSFRPNEPNEQAWDRFLERILERFGSCRLCAKALDSGGSKEYESFRTITKRVDSEQGDSAWKRFNCSG